MHAIMARRAQETLVDTPNNLEELDSPETVETGSLAIPDEIENLSSEGIWKRARAQRPLSNDGSTMLHFEILNARVMPPVGKDTKAKRYVLYALFVYQDTSTTDRNPIKIERRYTDFHSLFTKLKKSHPNEISGVYFPTKVLVGNFTTHLIAQRSAAFESFLTFIVSHNILRDARAFLDFLQEDELARASQLIEERRNEVAIPLLENSFLLLNKIFTDRSGPVLLMLCRLVAACTTSPVPHYSAERWVSIALNRFATLCDIDLLQLYVPLLHTCAHLSWQRGLVQSNITDRLNDMSKKGININNCLTLTQIIQKLDEH